MIWAALSIGLTVLLAVWTARPQASASAFGSPSRWLVLPDEPFAVAASALPEAAPVRSSLPAVIVTYPAWSASSQVWRAEKPLKPWFRSMAPYAVVAAFGAVSLDLTALGLGVPEAVPSHLLDGRPAAHESFVPDTGFSALFGASHDSDIGLGAVAWDQSGLMSPAWLHQAEASHDWWA